MIAYHPVWRPVLGQAAPAPAPGTAVPAAPAPAPAAPLPPPPPPLSEPPFLLSALGALIGAGGTWIGLREAMHEKALFTKSVALAVMGSSFILGAGSLLLVVKPSLAHAVPLKLSLPE